MHNLPSGYAVAALAPAAVREEADALAVVLTDCVAGGASVSFMHGLSDEKARGFWLGVADAAERDGRAVLAVRNAEGRIVGVVQMIPASYDNQPHRADIAKMLVLRAERKRGLGAALMRAAEDAAARAGKTLLTLDTASEDAERLYASLGWTEVGRIPNYALLPDGAPCATTVFYKQL